MKKPLGLALGLCFLAGSALASNTGFKLNYPLTFNPTGSNANWFSPPFFYFPNGQVGVTPQTSEFFCRDLNSPTPKDFSRVGTIVRFDASNDSVQTKFCQSLASPFDIVKGEGYILTPRSAGLTIDIVGSHDDEYAPNKGGTRSYPLTFNAAGSNLNIVSVPYHSKANNSEELCRAVNSPTPKDFSRVGTIVKFDPSNDSAITKFCQSLANPFDLVPGEAYGMTPRSAGIGVAFDVY